MVSTKQETTAVVDRLQKQLAQALERSMLAGSNIKRDGDQIIIPSWMQLPDAAKAIMKEVEALESDAQQQFKLKGHPDDTVWAFYQGVKAVFGELVAAQEVVGWLFGTFTMPERSITIHLGYDHLETVPWGHLEVPGLPISIDIDVSRSKSLLESELVVLFSYKKKFQPLVEKMMTAAKNYLRDYPIFKGKAIDSRYEFINLKGFPLDKIVYSAEEQEILESEVFNLLRYTKVLREQGRSLKRTVLLYGQYGTGKTLTALLAANICVEHKWTFVQVRPGDDIVDGLNFAKRNQPAMVFFEDIDQETAGDRDGNVNRILNTVDGMLGKGDEIILILTTNHIETIQRGMLRPGRIDTMVELGKMDDQAMRGLVRVYLPGFTGELEMPELLEAAAGYTPAFVVEALNRTWLKVFNRTGEIDAPIASTDITASMRALRPQFRAMLSDKVEQPETLDTAFKKVIKQVALDRDETMDATTEVLHEELDERLLKH